MSQEEFDQLQEQLIALKTQLYESKDTEQRSLKKTQQLTDELGTSASKLKALEAALVNANQSHQSALQKLKKVESSNSTSPFGGKLSGMSFGGKKAVQALEQKMAQMETAHEAQIQELQGQTNNLKQTMKAIFLENQTLKDENVVLKTKVGDDADALLAQAAEGDNGVARIKELEDEVAALKQMHESTLKGKDQKIAILSNDLDRMVAMVKQTTEREIEVAAINHAALTSKLSHTPCFN